MELLERDQPLQVLAAALDRARAGQGGIALISGEAGIGKSSFVDRFIQSHTQPANPAQPPVRVLKGHCDPLFTPTPLGPLFDIARKLGGKLLAQLEGEVQRAALFSGLLHHLGEGRDVTLMVIEDIHWADEATVDLVKFLGRRLQRARVLLVLTCRADEVASQPSLRMLLGDLAAAKALRIELPRLTVEAVSQLAAARVADNSTSHAIDIAELHRRTSGNPFFVTEILSSAHDGLPATICDAVLARAARLSPQARNVLDAAAVIGGRIDPAMLERTLGGHLDGLSECIQLGVLESTSEIVSFRHELAREAVLADIDPARRREFSRLAFEALRRAGGRRGDLAQLVQYADGAGDAASVHEFGIAAARAAASVGAHREAAAQYARVLAHSAGRSPGERAQVHEAYAEECSIIDRLPEAEQAWRQAVELWREVGDPLKEGENLAELAWPLVRSGRNAEADETSRRAIEVLETLPASRQLANAYRVRAHLLMLDRDCVEAVQLGHKAIELAGQFQDQGTIAAAENVIGSALLVSGDDAGLGHLERSIERAREIGMDAQVAIGLANIGASFGEQYRYAEAERPLVEGIAYTAERDLDYANHYMHAWLALTRLAQGRWREAEEAATWVIGRPNASIISRIVALVALGRVRARRGLADVMPVLDEALELATRTGTLQRLAPVRAARAEAAWLAGDGKRAAEEAAAAWDLAIRHQHGWFASELLYWRKLGGHELARPKWASTPFLDQLKGDWRRAAAQWEQLGCTYERAQALAQGDTPAQIAALEIFTRLGADPAAAALRQRMRGAGVRRIPRGPRVTTRQNPFGLTTRELEILGCLARGLTNGRIGAKLHVSPKTVDHHVSSVLSKLGASSRGEAARIAAAEQLLSQDREPPALN